MKKMAAWALTILMCAALTACGTASAPAFPDKDAAGSVAAQDADSTAAGGDAAGQDSTEAAAGGQTDASAKGNDTGSGSSGAAVTSAAAGTIVKEIDDIDENTLYYEPLGLDSVRLMDNGDLIAETEDELESTPGEEVKIADHVKDVYLLPFGNGGFRSLLFIREDGTVSAVNATELIVNKKLEIMDNLGGYLEVASLEGKADEDAHVIEVVMENGDHYLLDPYLM